MTEPIIHKVWPNGTEEWRLDGKLHRVDGPAITRPDGYEEWYLDGKLHRVDGPAITRPDGYEEWYLDGKLHRVDGPAIIWPNGTESWYLDGKPVTREDVMGPDEPTRRWSEIEWIECDGPERLAAAVAAGVRVEMRVGEAAYWVGSNNQTSQQMADCLASGNAHYRIPSRVVWPPALTVPEGMTPERLRDAAQLVEDGWIDTAVDQINRWADELAAQIGGKCSECGRAARGDEFAMSGMCQRCLNPTLAAQIDARPPTGAERYLSERMKDDDYAASYIAADARPPAPSAPEGMTPERLREIGHILADADRNKTARSLYRWADDLAAQIEGGGADDREASGPSDGDVSAAGSASDAPTLPDDPHVKVRLTVRFDGLNGERTHEIAEGGFWRYVTDERDWPERLIVRPGPAPSDRYEYPLAKVVSVHMDPIGAKR